MMDPTEGRGYRRELEQLRQKVSVIASSQAEEVAGLRRAIDDLERKLLSPAKESIDRSSSKSRVEPPPFSEEAAAKLPFDSAVKAEPERRVYQPIQPEQDEKEANPNPASKKPSGSFELQLGRVWLVRLGIGLLVTGLVLLGNYAYKNWVRELPAIVRLVCLFLGSFAMCGTGIQLAKRESLKRFGEVLLAGGLAFFYWCTFAAHHVERLQVIESPVLAGGLLLVAAGVVVGVSLRRDSRATATMGILLASYSTVLQPLGWLSAFSNVLLAGAGVGLMLRRAWAMPGVVSMAGVYGSFLWWQLIGGAGGSTLESSALWYLAPVWAIFSVTGVIGISGRFDSLTERGKSWFAGMNNGIFLLLFSYVWIDQYGIDGFWRVPAAFGLVLAGLGVTGRSRQEAGGVHLAQGLGALSLALALKLQGYHLALGFGLEAVALSFAFLRFRGKSELAFAVIAVCVAMVSSVSVVTEVSLWSRFSVAILLAGSAFPLRAGSDKCVGGSGRARCSRMATTLAFLSGGLLAIVLCVTYLVMEWQLLLLSGVALALAAFSLAYDRARRLPEAILVYSVYSLLVLKGLVDLNQALPIWSAGVAGVMTFASHVLWVRFGAGAAVKLQSFAGWRVVFEGLTALTVVVAIYRCYGTLDLAIPTSLVAYSLSCCALVAVGRYLVGSRLLQLAALLLLPRALVDQMMLKPGLVVLQFFPAIAAAVAVAMAGMKSPAGILGRVLGSICWAVTWYQVAGDWAGDMLALSGLIVAIALVRMKMKVLPEVWGGLGFGIVLLFERMADYTWSQMINPPGMHGVIVAGSVMATAVMCWRRSELPKEFGKGLLYGSCVLLAAWSSQLVVWHFDWKPVVVFWSLLGFALVSGGLWGKLAAFRHSGFVLLTIALGKLFLVDVWDFGAFTRVVAFISLGVALVGLGFFYNRFSEVLKKLLESDAAEASGISTTPEEEVES